ncbi:hypothetical protein CK203_091075 [Vitis vinifera]|uniref:Uncharacterized protein n=1 Tax=Vitis vinifera TaxID=29760 RepID=A0A438FH85_VITVI|nr:hypothetical protein CK203_091075 [Vitis vinifera]
MTIRRGARRRWQLRPQPSRWWSRMRVRPERPIRLKMRGPRIRGRNYFLTPHPGAAGGRGGDPVDDACTSASPFSYAKLEEKLK